MKLETRAWREPIYERSEFGFRVWRSGAEFHFWTGSGGKCDSSRT